MRKISQRFSEKKLMLILSGIFAAAALIGLLVALFVRFSLNKPINPKQNNSILSSQIANNESDIPNNEVIYESDELTEFDVPDTLRAVYLKPGEDFLLKENDSVTEIKKQIDDALEQTKKLGFNSVILFTETKNSVIFNDTVLKTVRDDIDIVDYTISSAKNVGIYTYVVYPVLLENKDNTNVLISDFSDKTFKNIEKRAQEFSKKYKPSAILLDKYEITQTESFDESFKNSRFEGKLEDYIREQVIYSIRKTRNTIRKNNNVSQVGILAKGVWANSSTDEKGSKTSSNYESYVDGHADTRQMVLNEKLNFVMVENLMPTDSVLNNFSIIAKWWSAVCEEANVPFYNIHAASKLNTSLGEFVSPDQLIRQVSIVSPLKMFGGCVFDSLSALKADYEGSTTLLLKYFNNQIADNLIFNKLIMSAPASNNVTTYDNVITFSGVTDPNFKTLFNGEKIETGEKGYFSFEVDLKIGLNTFKFSHKGKTVTYNITRKVEIIDSVTPVGKISVDGETIITLSVKAYKDSKVTAKIGSSTINLTEQKAQESYEENKDLTYVTYEGTFKTPSATYSVQNLGQIVFSALWQGYSENQNGATVTILAKPAPPKAESQAAVRIKADYAETFPTNILNDKSQPYCYPLPSGTIDYIVGNEISYSDSTGSFKYYKLQSGQRVYSKDLILLGEREKVNNKISAVDIKYDGRFVNLEIKNSWNVPYKYIEEPVSYNTSGNGVQLTKGYQITKITYRIFYTKEIDLSKVVLESNPIIKSAECLLKNVTIDGANIPVCDIVLTLKTAGGFFGATPSYNDTTLKLRLNTPAPIQKATNSYGYTLNGAKIVIDAGHGGGDPGAIGVIPSYTENVINEQIRQKVVTVLKSLGATVVATDNNVYVTADQRFVQYKAANPHLMISIHQNSGSSTARGPLGLYFNSYSQLLAENIIKSVVQNYVPSGNDRSFNYSFNRLKMTREPYYPSMLIECGFISNSAQHSDLINAQNQQKIAEQIVKGMINYFVSTGSLNYADLESQQPQTPQPPIVDKPNDEENKDSVVSSDIASSEISKSETLAYIDNKKILV